MPYKPKGLPPKETCNAFDPHTSKLCTRKAGAKTPHLGYGRCYVHGGMTPLPTTHEPLKLPAPIKLRELATTYYHDESVFDLRKEIAVCRAAIESLEIEGATKVIDAAPALNMLLNTSGRLVERLHNIERGRKYVIHIEEVQRIFVRVIDIIQEYVKDPITLREIANRMQDEANVDRADKSVPGDWRYADKDSS